MWILVHPTGEIVICLTESWAEEGSRNHESVPYARNHQLEGEPYHEESQ